jgi:hypothetical protein
VQALANPDNIYYSADLDKVFIGEDTNEGHVNDAMWAINPDTSRALWHFLSQNLRTQKFM